MSPDYMSRNGSLEPTAPADRGRRGMTLIEVILSCGILTVVLMYTLLSLMNLVRLNRMTAMEIASANAIRSQMEEVMTAARDNVAEHGLDNLTKAVLFYYGSNFDGQKVALGPNRTDIDRVSLNSGATALTYVFAVPEPGQSLRNVGTTDANRGQVEMSSRGLGRVTIYLTEPDVPAASSVDAAWNFLWRDMGQNINAAVVRGGFDMNRDGFVDNKTLDGGARPRMTMTLLGNAGRLNDELDIRQIPVDITVTYFTNASHQTQEYSLTRRMIVL